MTTAIVQTQRLIVKAISTGLGIISNPLLAGPLLFILTRESGQPGDILKDRLLEQTKHIPYDVPIEKIITALKYLFTYGIVSRANAYLNTIAQNNWALTAPTSEWIWEKELAVITGGSAGIGEQTVLRLIHKRVKVVILDISPPTHSSLKNNSKVHYIKTDVTDANAINAAAAEIKSKFGPPSILINNAGIGAGRLIVDNTPEFIAKIFGVNVFSHFYTAKAFLPDMVARNHGHIVTIASMASFMSLPGIADYASTKAGVLSFHETLKREIIHAHRAPKVLTTVVHPNWTRTALIAKEADSIEAAQGPLLTAAGVADAIVEPIFACRGRQVILPETLKAISTVKAWPNWMQDGLRGLLGKQTATELLKKSNDPAVGKPR